MFWRLPLMGAARLRGGALLIERQQSLQDLLVRQIARPAVGVEHGVVELLVRQVEPGGALVVEVGERPLLECGIAGTRRVDPGIAELDAVPAVRG